MADEKKKSDKAEAYQARSLNDTLQHLKNAAVDGTAQFRDDPRLKRHGLADIPLAYVPAVTADSPLAFVQQDKAEAYVSRLEALFHLPHLRQHFRLE